jgi:pyrroloquinoline quinone biosynthesis protein D
MTIPAKDPARFVETAVEDEVVVMLLDSGDFFSLRDTARDIWMKIDGARSRDAIVEAMAADYGASAETIAPEVDSFLAELRTVGLLRHD